MHGESEPASRWLAADVELEVTEIVIVGTAPARNRTWNLGIKSALLCRLSYGCVFSALGRIVIVAFLAVGGKGLSITLQARHGS